jgi:hypothetical protein
MNLYALNSIYGQPQQQAAPNRGPYAGPFFGTQVNAPSLTPMPTAPTVGSSYGNFGGMYGLPDYIR